MLLCVCFIKEIYSAHILRTKMRKEKSFLSEHKENGDGKKVLISLDESDLLSTTTRK